MTLPARIVSRKKNTVRVKVDDNERDVKCVPFDIHRGDWVLVNADLAVEKISVKEAREIGRLIKSQKRER